MNSIRLCIILSLLLPLGIAHAQNKMDIQVLKQQIIEELSSQKGVFALNFYNVATGQTFSINGDSVFHAASTMKTPVMVEVFRQADAGKLSLRDSILVKNKFSSIVDGSIYHLNKSDDSDTALYHHLREKRTIYNLMYRMIIQSSNLATNMIIELVGAGNVMETLNNMGIHSVHVLRGVEDIKAYELGKNNTTSADGLGKLFYKMAKGKAVSPESDSAMIRILADQRHNEIIPANLPESVIVAHKTGSITGVHHDSGIVILPDGRQYVLVILSKDLEDEDAAIAAMARVSRMVYYWFTHTVQ